MEQNTGDICDERESVAQWENQISEIIKWIREETNATGYVHLLASKLIQDLETLKVIGGQDDSSRPRWRNRRSAKLDRMELLNLQSNLNSELVAKQQIAEELAKTKDELATVENKLQEITRDNLALSNKTKDLEEQINVLNSRPSKSNIWDTNDETSTSLMKYLSDRFALPEQDSESDDDSDTDNASGTDSNTGSKSDLRGSDLESSLPRDTPYTQPYEPVYEPPWSNQSSSPEHKFSPIPRSPKSPHAKTHRSDRRSRVISPPSNFSHVAQMGPDQGHQVLIDLPKGGASAGGDEMARVKSMFQPQLKSIHEAQSRNQRPSSHYNGNAVSRGSDSTRPGRGRSLPLNMPWRVGRRVDLSQWPPTQN